MLAHPAKRTRLILIADASDTAMGAALEQWIEGKRQPLGFFSKQLTPTQARYNAYDRELLAVCSAVKHFRYMIEGRSTTIYTDHKSLTYAFDQQPTKASPRQQRHLDFVSQFTTDIRHVAGLDNGVADALSRVDDITLPTIVTTEEIAAAQRDDDELQDLLQVPGALNLKQLRLEGTETVVYCDISAEDIRPYIPRSLRKKIFDVVHGAAHISGMATRKQIAGKFVWP